MRTYDNSREQVLGSRLKYISQKIELDTTLYNKQYQVSLYNTL